MDVMETVRQVLEGMLAEDDAEITRLSKPPKKLWRGHHLLDVHIRLEALNQFLIERRVLDDAIIRIEEALRRITEHESGTDPFSVKITHPTEEGRREFERVQEEIADADAIFTKTAFGRMWQNPDVGAIKNVTVTNDPRPGHEVHMSLAIWQAFLAAKEAAEKRVAEFEALYSWGVRKPMAPTTEPGG